MHIFAISKVDLQSYTGFEFYWVVRWGLFDLDDTVAESSIMQIDVDIGSSSVARSVIGLVLGYVTSLVVDLAVLIEVCAFFVLLICESTVF